eukprot:3841866-Alexandrium_andersonii.AAC.1
MHILSHPGTPSVCRDAHPLTSSSSRPAPLAGWQLSPGAQRLPVAASMLGLRRREGLRCA